MVGVGQGPRRAGRLIFNYILHLVCRVLRVFTYTAIHFRSRRPIFGFGSEPTGCSSGLSIVIDLRYYHPAASRHRRENRNGKFRGPKNSISTFLCLKSLQSCRTQSDAYVTPFGVVCFVLQVSHLL